MICRELPAGSLARLLAAFGLEVREVPEGAPIPGSYWGAPEAGIRGSTLFVRPDTPVHSALHEACHLICADPARRAAIDTDAGGSDQEEDAVCYLQVVLADRLPGAGAARQMATWTPGATASASARPAPGSSTTPRTPGPVMGWSSGRGALGDRRRLREPASLRSERQAEKECLPGRLEAAFSVLMG